jgi:hypothetical protein
MPFKKTFNRSERAALRALGEIQKQGLELTGWDPFDFQVMLADTVAAVASDSVGDKNKLSRVITFRYGDFSIDVTVTTGIGQEYSDEHPSETIFWEPVRAHRVERGSIVKEYVRRKYPDHAYWSRGKH